MIMKRSNYILTFSLPYSCGIFKYDGYVCRPPVLFDKYVNKQQVWIEITSTKVEGSNYCDFNNNYSDVVSLDYTAIQKHDFYAANTKRNQFDLS